MVLHLFARLVFTSHTTAWHGRLQYSASCRRFEWAGQEESCECRGRQQGLMMMMLATNHLSIVGEALFLVCIFPMCLLLYIASVT